MIGPRTSEPALADQLHVPPGRLHGWEPEQDEELQPVLQRLAGALVVEMPALIDYTSVCRGAYR